MINIIVAVSTNGVIGLNGNMPWHIPKDLHYFKQITTPHTIIMGRYTYHAIGKPLPNRKNIVLTKTLTPQQGILIAGNWEQALNMITNEEQVFIIGGQQVFEQALEKQLVKRIYRTLIHYHFDGDTFFPEINLKEWKLISSTFSMKDEKNPYDLTFEIWSKHENESR